MKKVWVLEKFVTKEDMAEDLKKILELREYADEQGDADGVVAADGVKASYEKMIAENPDGYWFGYQGKTIYRQFCECAHETMRYLRNSKFRVIEGEIADDAIYWLGYKIVKENPGVLRYLYATL